MFRFPIKTLNTIKRVLLRQEKEIEKNIEEFEKEDPVKAPALVESSEPGTDSAIADTHTKTLVLEQKLKQASQGIKKALSKIRNGNYGKCDNCGKRIEKSRLLVIPITSFCLSCSKKVQK